MNLLNKLVLPVLVFGLVGCSAIDKARSKLNDMPEAEYQEVLTTAKTVSVVGGQQLKKFLHTEDQAMVQMVFLMMANAVQNDRLGPDLDKFLDAVLKDRVFKFVKDEELNRKINETLKDALDFASVWVGNLDLGLDGKLSVREKEVLVTVLMGVAEGLGS